MKNKQLVKTTWWIPWHFLNKYFSPTCGRFWLPENSHAIPFTQGPQRTKTRMWPEITCCHKAFSQCSAKAPCGWLKVFSISLWCGCVNGNGMLCHFAAAVVTLSVTWNLRVTVIVSLTGPWLLTHCVGFKHLPFNIWFNPHNNLKR